MEMTEREERIYIQGQLRAKLELAAELLRGVMHECGDAERNQVRIALQSTKLAYDLMNVSINAGLT